MVKLSMEKRVIRESLEDRVFNVLVYTVLSVMFLVVFYPLIYIVSSSFSSPDAVAAGRVVLWPVDPSLEGYKAVFSNNMIGTGYFNSIVYAVFGTLINVSLTMITAYALACPSLPWRNGIMLLFTFTMLFDGGMIPNYILLRNLRMLNTRWAMLIPGAIGIYNMIITRTFIGNSIPAELKEAADIDG
ncbi:MAG: carbohydrate ABC transporter permease, partial [Spirochaetaceae bacterium]|nr:carbohydrate ABC transporter permease [Spirochaetaceae bacterium]